VNEPKLHRRDLARGLSRDQGRLRRLLGRAEAPKADAASRAAFEQALAQSISAREVRQANLPVPSFDDSLPVSREAERIVELIRAHQVVVIAGETGSGKTTQLPKLCLAAGRGAAGLIGCTQPRRIAARAVARRVAQELNVELGGAVGFQVRFNESVSERSHIKFMTDGILLAEIQSDRFLSAYDTLIIDEAHERSLNIDFLLGYLKDLLPRRPDLKLIVTSATIDTARFARHFGDAPVLSVEGRGYPVEVRYRPPGEGEGSESFSSEGSAKSGRRREENDSDPISAIVAVVDEITREDRLGDVLIFLAGEREIRDVHQALERRKYRETEVLPLYARLSTRDQDRVFNPGPQRRIVLATNVAETSLTVPRIRYVIDPGTARVKRYSPRAKLDRLHIEPISQASADQRKGRCGRVAAGVCYRLYSEPDYLSRPRYTDPEILRASLANVILRMLSLGLGRVEDFPFLEAPDSRAIADGWQQLHELGAVDRERKLTPVGRNMARLPVDAKLARILIAAREHGVLREALVIAAFLGIQDPRERPADQRQAADQAHAEFADPKSEFLGVLKLWDAYREAHEELTQSKLRDWCGKRFLGFLRMREWRELHRQLLVLGDEPGALERAGEPQARSPQGDRNPAHRPQGRQGRGSEAQRRAALPIAQSSQVLAGERANPTADYVALHRALIAGLPSQVGYKTEKAIYEGPRARKYALFPGSPLAKQPPPWVLSAVMLDTQRVWGLMNARIEPDWIIAELEHLLARKHFDPHWSRTQGRVIGSEQISLFGLVLAPKRPVHYGGLYPAEAREIFVRQGLVPGEINTRTGFVARNLATLEKAREEEAKLRRAGLVADEDWQARWYLDRVPAEINSVVAMEKWVRALAPDAQRALEWSIADLLPGEGSEADRFPKFLALGEARLPLHYRFEPGAPDDGVTLDVPLHLLNALDAARMTWLVPGLVEEKVAALIRSLPKALRRNFVPAPDFARAFTEAWRQCSPDTLGGELARFLSRATGASVAPTDFDESVLEPHLRMNLRLLGADRRPVASSRDLVALRESHGERAEQAFAARAGRDLAVEGLREFPATPIPEQVPGEAGILAFPALVDTGDGVALRVFAERDIARQSHAAGVRRLLRLALADKARLARKQLPVSPKLGLLYATINEFESAAGGKPATAGSARQDRLREDLIEAALNAVLAADLDAIRDRAAFEQRAAAAGRTLFADAMQRLELAEDILERVAALRPKLEPPLMGWATGNLDDLRAQLAGLIPPGFLRDAPAAALTQYPRYLQAMLLRVERLLRDPARDQGRMLEIKPFVDALDGARQRGELDRPGWRELRWDLEELRVSLFAQELGTRGAVSTKRLVRQLEAIQGRTVTRSA
jgi:ATP-dependent helicase HrpA